MDFQRLEQGTSTMEAYRSEDKWPVPDVRAVDLHQCTSNGIACEECKGNDEGSYAYASAMHHGSVRAKVS